MAYASTVTRTRSRQGRQKLHIITVVETGVVDAASEFTVDNLPQRGTIVEHRAVLVAGVGGTATTVDPELGIATTTKEIFENGTAAATTTNLNLSKGYTARTLFGRSGANGTTAGAGSITTTITVLEGSL